jgi:hypothetical protein
VLPDVEQIRISRDQPRRTALDSRSEVLVVNRIFADTVQDVVAWDEIE